MSDCSWWAIKGLLPDWVIQDCVKIEHMDNGDRKEGVVSSYGLGSYGYDARVGYKFKIFTNVHTSIVDIGNFDPKSFVDVNLGHAWSVSGPDHMECGVCGKIVTREEAYRGMPTGCPKQANHILIPPNSFALAETVEVFHIPRDVLAICLGKSTYARCGIIANVTPLEPEWNGRVTIEISNTTPLPAKIYAGQGIIQVIFLRAQEACRRSYADKKGKYQGQTGLTLPKGG